MAEQQFRRALAISQGDATVLFQSPLSATLLALSAIILFVPPLVRRLRKG
jgi:putative tricarboxylic transport membrane protein